VASLASPSPSKDDEDAARAARCLRARSSPAAPPHVRRGATNGAEQEADAPRQPDQVMRRGGDREGRENHAADREQDDSGANCT